MELQREVIGIVEQTKKRSGWPVRRTLAALDIRPGTYYRWRLPHADKATPKPTSVGSMYAVLPSERQAIIDFALKHPEVRHRELAWKMLDENVCAVSSSTVYRVLREANLVCRWQPKQKVKGQGRSDAPGRPDQLWQTDIRYTKVSSRNYYLLSFLDVYSRYIVYHELLRFMDGQSVSIAAAAALETLPAGVTPTIQSDHGSGFISREFAETLAGFDVGHRKIRPHTPTDNAEIERMHRTIGEKIDQHEFDDFDRARETIAGILDHYNNERLHSSLQFLRPADYYRGNPEMLLAERSRKLTTARELRKQENIKLRQRLIPFPKEETVIYSTKATVSF